MCCFMRELRDALCQRLCFGDFIYSKLLCLIKSSLKLSAAPEMSEAAAASLQKSFRKPLPWTLNQFWCVLLWQLAQLPAAIVLLLLFFSCQVSCSSDTVCGSRWLFYACVYCPSRPLCPQGKKNSIFREYYVGPQRHCKVVRLCPAVGYTFRVAALNDIGTRFAYLSL